MSKIQDNNSASKQPQSKSLDPGTRQLNSNFDAFHLMSWSVIDRKVRSHGIAKHQIEDVKEELFSEAGEIFINAKKTFLDDKGAIFSTWLYTQLDYRIGNYIKRRLSHLTPNGRSKFQCLSDVEENLLVIQMEQFSDVISEEKEKIIDEIYKKAYDKWDTRKCMLFYFVYAFDETGFYNKYIKDFVLREKEEFKKLNINIVKPIHITHIEKIKEIVEKEFNKDKKEREKLFNNVKKTVVYHLKKYSTNTPNLSGES